jgi:hypothetical protein
MRVASYFQETAVADFVGVGVGVCRARLRPVQGLSSEDREQSYSQYCGAVRGDPPTLTAAPQIRHLARMGSTAIAP